MVIIIAVIVYLLLIWASIFCICKIKQLTKTLQTQKEFADNLEKELYKDLRMVQYKALDISNQAKTFTKNKNSILTEAVSTLALALLPFKKIKSVIYLHKLSKKCLIRK